MTTTVKPQELVTLLEKGGLDLVDVRDDNEWQRGYIPGSRLAPLPEIAKNAAAHLPSDNLVLVCASGPRSNRAAKLAEGLGYQNIYVLEGGTTAWKAAGLPWEMPPKQSPSTSPPAAPPEPTPEDDAGEPALDALVGQNLRDLRRKAGLSLDDLAARAQVSRTLLGQIEIGRAAPTIGVVWRLAQVLDVPFSTLLSTTSEARDQKNVLLKSAKAKRLTSADGRFSSRALFPFGAPRTVEFYELYLAPHSVDEAEPHQAGTRENLVVTQGRLELTVGEEQFSLVKGDAVFFRADVPHVYKNPGSEECWMYLVMTYTTPVS